jgi:hypothetical protein
VDRIEDDKPETEPHRSHSLVIPSENAEPWMLHLQAEVSDRQWNWSGNIALDIAGNSGVIEVGTLGKKGHDIEISWRRPRSDSLEVEVSWLRSQMPDSAVLDFLDAVAARLRAGTTARKHRRTTFLYRGLPWRGELWFGDDLRLGPPSKFCRQWSGPQAVLVDAVAEGIGDLGALSNLNNAIEELRVFLCVALGRGVEPGECTLGWASDMDEQGRATKCELRMLGYREEVAAQGMPANGSAPAMRRESDPRPDPGREGYWPDIDQMRAPDDIDVLWNCFRKLDVDRRRQFLGAATAYAVALHLWGVQPSAHATFLVVACEALKPPGKRHKDMNIYDVVAGLLGQGVADELRDLNAHPQKVRNDHVHRGALHGSELGPSVFVDFFGDPSFQEMQMKLAPATRACLVEWLRRGGM